MFSKKYNRRDVQLIGHCFFSKSTGMAEYDNYAKYYEPKDSGK